MREGGEVEGRRRAVGGGAVWAGGGEASEGNE